MYKKVYLRVIQTFIHLSAAYSVKLNYPSITMDDTTHFIKECKSKIGTADDTRKMKNIIQNLQEFTSSYDLPQQLQHTIINLSRQVNEIHFKKINDLELADQKNVWTLNFLTLLDDLNNYFNSIKQTGAFEIFQGKGELYYFRLKDLEDNIILRSEGFQSFIGIDNCIQAVIRRASNLDNFRSLESRDKRNYFLLMAPNGEVIGVSQMLDNEQQVEEAIQLVQQSTKNPKILDLTS